MQTHEDLLEQIQAAVVGFEEEQVGPLCEAALNAGMDAYDTVVHGLAAGMEEVGVLYDQKTYFVPEVLMCADTFYAGLEVLKPHIKATESSTKGTILIGTVEGDVHDIGKNLVAMMLDASGFTVHDLGRDVPIDRFIEEQQRTGAQIVALSALMTTSMLAIPVIVEKMRAANPDVKILIGGAPISWESVALYKADGYANNATGAVQEAVRLMQESKLVGEK